MYFGISSSDPHKADLLLFSPFSCARYPHRSKKRTTLLGPAPVAHVRSSIHLRFLGCVAIFTSQEEKRTGGIVTGIVALGTSLVILFLYLDFLS